MFSAIHMVSCIIDRHSLSITLAKLNNNYPFPSETKWLDCLSETAGRHGITMKSSWIHVVQGEAGRSVTELLMSLPQVERPDGIFIADENLIEDVSAGLLRSGVEVGRDVDVVAHSNLPCPRRAPVPIQRLGEPPTEEVLLDPVFENEMAVHAAVT